MEANPIPRDVAEVALRLCEGLATPLSLSVAILIRYREWDQLAVKRVDPSHYRFSDAYRRDAAAVDFLRKWEDLPTSCDRAAVAVENFWVAEKQCFRANERLSPFLFGGFNPDSMNRLAWRILSLARKKIAQTLGGLPELVEGRFGPGATYGDTGRLTTVADKMSSRPTLTASAIPYLFQWGGTAWATACAEAQRKPSFVSGNRFTTVPKDCTKDRGIAIEPSINVFFQLGLGRVIRRRLRSVGIDLDHGQDTHRQVACEASIKGHLATIDLSNASDTVCRNLVKLLLPPSWYDALDALRSPTTLIGGKTVRLEKFSSMGNGYTFELETLLFFGICSAVLEHYGELVDPGHTLLVYGDDIIVPTPLAREVISVLRFCGFSPNPSKTFLEGNFRESCGGDYFRGSSVRSHFLKTTPKLPSDWIGLANGLFRLGLPDSNGDLSCPRPLRSRAFCLDQIPLEIRKCRGPEILGDLVITDRKERWQYRWRDGIRDFRVWKPLSSAIPWRFFRPDVVLACAVYGIGDGLKGITPRSSTTGYRLDWVSYS